MKQSKELPSKYGPVNVDLIECDHCDMTVQPKYMINWVQVFPNIGIDTRTFGDVLSDELHFCGLEHLQEYLKEHLH